MPDRKHRDVLIAQLTDTHVTTDGRQARDLDAAIDWLNAPALRSAVVLLSGDAVNSGTHAQYERLRASLARSVAPVYVVPGNHDERDALRATLPDTHYPDGDPRLNYVIESAPVRIVALNTSESRRPGGILDQATLDWFDRCLSAAPERPTLAFMHHPPFRTGVNLADVFGFAGLRRFTQIVARHPQLRRIVAGHVHCERSARIAGALATTSISTTPQRVPELFERRLVGLRPEPAGFALHRWANDTFTTTTLVQHGVEFIVRASPQADP